MYSTPTEDELDQLVKSTSTSNIRSGYVNVQGYTLPERYYSLEKAIKEFEVYDTDVWICGFPKTGTTWISEIAWLILNDFDYEGAKVQEFARTCMLEFSMLFDPNTEVHFDDDRFRKHEIDSIGCVKALKHPRSIKSHLPYPLLPNQIVDGTRSPRIICTARNPMDTCVSYHCQCRNYENFTGTLEDFSTLFLFDKVNYGPFAAHVLTFWEQRHQPNVLFLTYEEMKRDLSGVIDKVAKHLGKIVSGEDSRKLQEHVSFDSMKKNDAVNHECIGKLFEDKGAEITPFIRRGEAGGYRRDMSSEMIAQFDYWMTKRFEGSALNLLNV